MGVQIQMEMSKWEQAGCGTGFRVRDEATWILSAADLALSPRGGLPRFTDEYHDQTTAEVPLWRVAGTVRANTDITYPQLPVTGEPRSFAPDTEHPALTILSEAEGGISADFSEYLVELDVDAECAFPSLVVSDWEQMKPQAAVL